MPAHLIPSHTKARPLGFLAASVGTGVLVLMAFASGGVEETPASVTTPATSAVTVRGVVLRPPSTMPAAPAASVVTIPSTESAALAAPRPVRRASPPATAPPATAPPATLGPPATITAPGRTGTTTTTAPTSTTTDPSTTTVVTTTDTTSLPD